MKLYGMQYVKERKLEKANITDPLGGLIEAAVLLCLVFGF